ncbi:MAG TPA: multicopper oxidase family protein [Rhizomicrobium sp.]|nr:multicopper oxidase family protein [Rhizomicrobium sp.]
MTKILHAAALAAALSPLSAQAQDRVVTNPATLEVQRAQIVSAVPAPKAGKSRRLKSGKLVAAPAPEIGTTAAPGEKLLDLHVKYTDSKIYNPNTGMTDNVRLRSYVGTGYDPNAPYVAPTIEVNPGDTVRMTLHNDLPADDPSCPKVIVNMDRPHCFNTTNMHSHGLWISPAGNSDNVLIEIQPGVTFQYEYNIPSDHPAGTFWYHPHEHGSTALQVSSGMAGALIVRGNRVPTPTTHGDLDTLLKGFTERVLVLQQIQYACVDDQGRIKVKYKTVDGQPVTDKNGNYTVVQWVCDPGDVGGIEFYDDKTPSGPPYNGPYGFGPGNWAASARFTSINGLVLPVFEAKAGDVERWRMIHAGVRDTIQVQFYRLKSQAPSTDRLLAADEANYVQTNCTGDPIPYHVVAQDGLTMAQAHGTNIAVLQPGYRADALVVFPQAGNYCVVNAQVQPAASVSRSYVTPRLLGIVKASGQADVKDIGAYLTNQLVGAAKRTMPKNVVGTVVADLKDNLKLTSFTPHPDIEAGEVTGNQYLTFYIDTSDPDNTLFEVAQDAFDWQHPTQEPFNPHPYDPNRIDRHLVLGGVDEWTMQSRFVSHPFHIHVNPFQIVAIYDPNGKDVSAPGAVDAYGIAPGQPPDPQYPGLKGVWKDTLWIKNAAPPGSPYPQGVYTIVARTRYQRYIGAFVLHCHILDHEDQGMMQNVEIEIPTPGGGKMAPAQPMPMQPAKGD